MFGLGFLCGIIFLITFAWVLIETMDPDDLDKIIDHRRTTKKTPWKVFMPEKKEDEEEKK